MGRLETNDWIIINSIIYNIYTIKNTEEMQEKFMARLKSVVDFDSCDFRLASRNETDVMYNGKSIVYRESDITIKMVLGEEERFLGVVTLNRKKGKKDFDYDDIFILDILKDHMSFSLSQRLASSVDVSGNTNIQEFVNRYCLTKREEEVLMHMLSRQDNHTISDELSISINTLKKHERNIYQKCNVSSRMQLFKLVVSEA